MTNVDHFPSFPSKASDFAKENGAGIVELLFSGANERRIMTRKSQAPQNLIAVALCRKYALLQKYEPLIESYAAEYQYLNSSTSGENREMQMQCAGSRREAWHSCPLPVTRSDESTTS